MKIFLLLLIPISSFCQDYTQEKLLARLKSGSEISADLLSKRSVVLHSFDLTEKQINTIHENMVRTGIDAIAYFPIDEVLSGWDMTKAYSKYFSKREIANLVIVLKSTSGYTIHVTDFSNDETMVKQDQPEWTTQNVSLNEALTTLYRSALSSNKSKNFLINEIPETDLPVTVIGGLRAERFPYDLKVDKLAVRKTDDEVIDKQLEEGFSNYPMPYQLVDSKLTEEELRKQGFLYTLCFVHTRSSMAKTLLGYTVNPSESAFVSVTFSGGQVQLKNIPANTLVYKVYIRHIDSGNIFLGNKWDADLSLLSAIKNYIDGFKVELKIN